YHPHIGLKLDGSFEIRLGDGGWLDTGIVIKGDQPVIGTNWSEFLTGPYAVISEQGAERCSLIAAAEMRKAAETTFSRLGVDDLTSLIEAIDKYHRFGGARL